MLYHLEAVRANIRNRDGKRVFFLGKDDRLTNEARDFLTRERIEILPAEQAKITRYRLLNGGYMEQKPERMTHLNGDVLVEKTHPRITFRGEIDALEAEILLCALEIPCLQKELEELLDHVRELLRCEVMDAPLKEKPLMGMNSDALRQRSHFPQEYYGQPHFMPSVADGKAILWLNHLRTTVRKVERAAVAALPERTDIMQALNRMSSFVYILMIREKSGKG